MLLFSQKNENHSGIYLAYGLDMLTEQMLVTCPCAVITAVTMLPDHILVFRGRDYEGVPTLEHHLSGRAPSVLWRISPYCERNLDIMWCCPRLYHKEKFEVKASGVNFLAYTYIINKLPHGRVLPYGRPTLKTLAIIARGYQKHGFDKKLLLSSLRFSTPVDPDREFFFPF